MKGYEINFRKFRFLLDNRIWRTMVHILLEKIYKRIPEVSITDLVGVWGGEIANKLVIQYWQTEFGNISLEELATLLTLVLKKTPKRILEIGTLNGRTTLNLALNTGADTIIYTVDMSENSGYLFQNNPFSQKIRHMVCKSSDFDFEKHNFFDLIILDGGHRYEEIEVDFYNAINSLAPNGIILIHDYCFYPGMMVGKNDIPKFLNKIYKKGTYKLQHIRGTAFCICSKAVADSANFSPYRASRV